MNTSIRFLVPVLVVLASSLCACTSLQSVSVTQIPANRSKPVRAEVDNTALLGIHFDNDFVDDLTAELMQQCPHGKITGILTKQENTTYVIVQTRRVIASGWCVYEESAPAPPHEATALNEGK
jgi:hypothetical protein